MMSSVIVWDVETVPDLRAFAAANGLIGAGAMLVSCRLASLSALRRTMLTTTPKRNPASKSNRSDAVPRPSEGHVPAQRELQRRHPAAEVGTLLGLR